MNIDLNYASSHFGKRYAHSIEYDSFLPRAGLIIPQKVCNDWQGKTHRLAHWLGILSFVLIVADPIIIQANFIYHLI